MQDTLLSIILLFLSLNIIGLTVIKAPFKNIFDFIIIFFAILVILYAFSNIYYQNKTEEHYKDAEDDKDADEDISSFSQGLTIYNSCFSKKSYPIASSRTWYNVSDYFLANTCPDIRMADTHMTFDHTPAYSKINGFYLGSNSLHGPMCHRMGITANESFSIFMTFKFSSFVKDSEMDLDIIRLFANTINNNGLAVYIEKNYAIEDDFVKAMMVLEYANKKYILAIPKLNTSFTYMLAISKNSLRIEVIFYPNIGDLSSTPSMKFVALDQEIDMGTDVLLSNKEMVINQNKNVAMHIFNIGFFNKPLQEYHFADIYNHTQKLIHKNNHIVKTFITQINDLNNEISKIRRCPYDDFTCKTCSGVSNWANVSDILKNATPECLSAVNEFCKMHPNHENCVCWDPTNVQSKTDACVAYKSIFSPAQESANICKTKYNLCSCDDIPKKSANETEKKGPQLVEGAPIILNKVFDTVNKTDMELYHELPIS